MWSHAFRNGEKVSAMHALDAQFGERTENQGEKWWDLYYTAELHMAYIYFYEPLTVTKSYGIISKIEHKSYDKK